MTHKSKRNPIIALLVALAVFFGVMPATTTAAFAATDAADYTAFSYSGAWTAKTGERYSNTAGASASVTVDVGEGGGTVTFSGVNWQASGYEKLSIDGATPVLADAYLDVPCCTVRDWLTTPKLAEGEHTFTFTVTSQKNAAATANYFSISGVKTSNGTVVEDVVEPTPTPTPTVTPTPTPTPTVTPAPTPTPTTPPGNDGFVSGVTKPNADNTGFGEDGRTDQLTVIQGDFHPKSNTTYQNIDVTGRIIIDSGVSNVLIDNCRVQGKGATSGEKLIVDTGRGHNTTLRFCDIYSDPRWGGTNGIGTKNFTIERSDIHHVVDGVRINRTPTSNSDDAKFAVVKDSYIHDLLVVSPDPLYKRSDNKTHSDGIQNEGSSNALVTGNYIDAHHSPVGDGSNVSRTTCSSPYVPVSSGGCAYTVANSALMYNSGTTGTITNWVVDRNWFSGGETTINHRNSCGSGCKITNNIFEKTSQTGTVIYPKTSSVIAISGNKFTDGTPAP